MDKPLARKKEKGLKQVKLEMKEGHDHQFYRNKKDCERGLWTTVCQEIE